MEAEWHLPPRIYAECELLPCNAATCHNSWLCDSVTRRLIDQRAGQSLLVKWPNAASKIDGCQSNNREYSTKVVFLAGLAPGNLGPRQLTLPAQLKRANCNCLMAAKLYEPPPHWIPQLWSWLQLVSEFVFAPDTGRKHWSLAQLAAVSGYFSNKASVIIK